MEDLPAAGGGVRRDGLQRDPGLSASASAFRVSRGGTPSLPGLVSHSLRSPKRVSDFRHGFGGHLGGKQPAWKPFVGQLAREVSDFPFFTGKDRKQRCPHSNRPFPLFKF